MDIKNFLDKFPKQKENGKTVQELRAEIEMEKYEFDRMFRTGMNSGRITETLRGGEEADVNIPNTWHVAA